MRQPRPLRSYLTRALLTACALGLLLAAYPAGQAAGVWLGLSDGNDHGWNHEPVSVVEMQVRGLMVDHDCWINEAPRDVAVPGHVIVERAGQVFYGGPAVVEQALAQVFEGSEQGLTVYAFCR